MATTLKLHAFLAHAGVASRREAEQLISQGKVTVNGQPGYIGQRIDPTTDQVYFQHQHITLNQPLVYILINKPTNVVSTTNDELGRRTVLDLLPSKLKATRLYPVGRLDADSQGLVLLTNDGDLAYRLTHPSQKVTKTYYVELDRPPSDKALDHLRRGVKLKEGFTHPTELELLPERGATWLSIQLHEGWNRQIRRMMERVGYQVKHLVRVKLGPFSLSQLEGRPFLQLTDQQAQQARQKVGLSAN